VISRSLLAALLAVLSLFACRREPRPAAPSPERIVSLAPAVTETLFAIGAGAQVIGVSDYCEAPPVVKKRPRLGTSITPNYEAIARLKPTLLVSEKNAAARARELEALAPTRLLPWLSLQEVASSVRELGRLSDHAQRADALANELLEKLDKPEPKDGPRVLLVLGETSGDEVWFIRKNSLHGSVLAAAGARNAVAEQVLGPPQLSFERLLALDPDAIVVLLRPDPGRDAEGARRKFDRFPTLTAVRDGRIGSIEDPAAFSHGPGILALVGRVRGELERLKVLK
jgi:ABC-type Fe3+-hydroxamate transport system substrate-binding protein